jgi:hypothetical protein
MEQVFDPANNTAFCLVFFVELCYHRAWLFGEAELFHYQKLEDLWVLLQLINY